MDLSDAYANAAHIPNGEAFPGLWARRAGNTAARHRGRIEVLPYGPTDRQRVHLIAPEGPAEGTFVFVHGGYWQAFSPVDFLHLAEGALGRGWAVAMPGYDLCPDVRLAEITTQVLAAVEAVAETTEGPLVLSGHSAGGQLVARMGSAGLTGGARARIARIVPISPLSDLRPLRQTAMNATLNLTEEEAAAESPALHPAPPWPVHVWVGGDERPAFLDQARGLGQAWDCPVTVEPGRHHFDVIEGLEGDSPLLRTCLG